MSVASILPQHHPKQDYHDEPVPGWQSSMHRALKLKMYSRTWPSLPPTLVCYGKFQVQAYWPPWSLHFQISVGGDEFRNNDGYGDLTGRALICFDVEGGGQVSRSNSACLSNLQQEVATALQSAGVIDRLGIGDHRRLQHHIVWETVDMSDQADPALIQNAANRVLDYIDAIYPVASAVLRDSEAGSQYEGEHGSWSGMKTH